MFRGAPFRGCTIRAGVEPADGDSCESLREEIRCGKRSVAGEDPLQEKINVLRLGLRRCMAGLAALAVVVVVQGAWGQGVRGGAANGDPPTFGGVSGRREPTHFKVAALSSSIWLECIEVYTLPWDPEWRTAAEQAAFPQSFDRSATEIEEQRKALSDRVNRSKRSSDEKQRTLDQGRKEIDRRVANLIEDLRAKSDRDMPLTVIRAWDGIAKAELILTFGRGQRGISDRLADGKPVQVLLGLARPGDALQSARPTATQIRPSSSVPSEFLRLANTPHPTHRYEFGEVDASALPAVVVGCTKDPAPGSGLLHLSRFAPPAALGIDSRYPWYAEFRLYELADDGKRAREVRFNGSNVAVAADSARTAVALRTAPSAVDTESDGILRAIGRVEVKSPQPWGYEAEVVKWYGVAPKDRLVPGSQSSRSPSGRGRRERTAGPDGSSAPSQPAPPLEENAPAELPEDPSTPDVPAARP